MKMTNAWRWFLRGESTPRSWIQPRARWKVVDNNGDNPRILGEAGPPVFFYTWEEAVIYVNDRALHIVEEK